MVGVAENDGVGGGVTIVVGVGMGVRKGDGVG